MNSIKTHTSLSPDLAFVVQLNPNRRSREQLAGRVEHISSGQSTYFTSLDSLYEFMGKAPRSALRRR